MMAYMTICMPLCEKVTHIHIIGRQKWNVMDDQASCTLYKNFTRLQKQNGL